MMKRKNGVKKAIIMVALILVTLANCAIPAFAAGNADNGSDIKEFGISILFIVIGIIAWLAGGVLEDYDYDAIGMIVKIVAIIAMGYAFLKMFIMPLMFL